MKVTVSYVCPPIPIRSMDWEAHMDGDEGNESMARGFGHTKLAALENLLEEFDPDEPEAKAIWQCINEIERQW